jgi:hypothetical protein
VKQELLSAGQEFPGLRCVYIVVIEVVEERVDERDIRNSLMQVFVFVFDSWFVWWLILCLSYVVVINIQSPVMNVSICDFEGVRCFLCQGDYSCASER